MSETCPYCQEWRNDCNTHLERIKELEAEQDQLVSKALYEMKCAELTALRKRIDDAPVLQQTHVPVEGNNLHFRVVSLICKEDLQK